jgi:hypothetical protein
VLNFEWQVDEAMEFDTGTGTEECSTFREWHKEPFMEPIVVWDSN